MEVDNNSRPRVNITRKRPLTLRNLRKRSFANTQRLRERLVPVKNRFIRVLAKRARILEKFITEYEDMNIGSEEAEVNAFMFLTLSEELSDELKTYFIDAEFPVEFKQRIRSYIRSKDLANFNLEEDVDDYARKIVKFLHWIINLSIKEVQYREYLDDYAKHLLQLFARVSVAKDEFLKKESSVHVSAVKENEEVSELANMFKKSMRT